MGSSFGLLRVRWGRNLRSNVLKRVVDVAGAAVGLSVALIPMALAAVAIRLSMGSPIFFRQRRPGRDGVPFTLIKFRSMKDGDGPPAERITTVGRFLRRTSIDELPELWNVLTGDMSLVGPRPLRIAYLERYSPRQARRHEIRPGLTGYAQVHGRNALSWDERLEMDVRYVDTWTLTGDLRIIGRTVLAVVKSEGISPEGSETMTEFRGPDT